MLMLVALMLTIAAAPTTPTINNDADACTLAAPASGSGIHNGSNLYVSWAAVSGADKYNVSIVDQSTMQEVYNDDVSSTNTTANSGIVSGHNYKAYVRAICENQEPSTNIIVVDVMGV